MTDRRIADNILVISDSEKNAKLLCSLGGLCYNTFFARNTDETLAVSADRSLSLILADMPNEKLDIQKIYNRTNCDILILTKREFYGRISKSLPRERITVLTKPISSHTLQQVLRIILTDGIEAGRWKIEEIKIVTHAKCILMEYLQMSENQAHKYIEKQAMDMRITKREIAENILKTYES